MTTKDLYKEYLKCKKISEVAGITEEQNPQKKFQQIKKLSEKFKLDFDFYSEYGND